MFCPNCGKQTKDEDNFCRYCGCDLRIEETAAESYIEHTDSEILEEDEQALSEIFDEEPDTKEIEEENDEDETFDDIEDELVLYDVKKHWMSLFWPAFLTPVFLAYFWNIFLNTHSIFSWFVVIGMLVFIVYPALRFKSDRFVITNKYAHIKTGAFKPEEQDIPITKFEIFDTKQTSMGKLFDYGIIIFCANSEKYEYKYIESTDYVKHIFEEPKKFIKESL